MTVNRRTIGSFKELADSIPPEVPLIFIDIDDTITHHNHNWLAISKEKYSKKLADIFSKARRDCENDKKFDPTIKVEQAIYIGKHYGSLFIEEDTPQIIRELSLTKAVCILTSGRPCIRKQLPLKQGGIFHPVVFSYTNSKGKCIENIVKFLQKYKIHVGAAALVDNHPHKLKTFSEALRDQPGFKKYLFLYNNPVAEKRPNKNEFYRFWYRICVDVLKNGSYNHWIRRQSTYRHSYLSHYRQAINVLRRKMIQHQKYNKEY